MWGRPIIIMGFPGGSDSPPAMREPRVSSLGGKEPLQKGMATHSSILAWRMPWTEESDGLHSTGLQRIEHSWVTNLFTFFTFRSIITLSTLTYQHPVKSFPCLISTAFWGYLPDSGLQNPIVYQFFFFFFYLFTFYSLLPPLSLPFPLPSFIFFPSLPSFILSFLTFYQVSMHFFFTVLIILIVWLELGVSVSIITAVILI